jgi:hypothetical protein
MSAPPGPPNGLCHHPQTPIFTGILSWRADELRPGDIDELFHHAVAIDVNLEPDDLLADDYDPHFAAVRAGHEYLAGVRRIVVAAAVIRDNAAR